MGVCAGVRACVFPQMQIISSQDWTDVATEAKIRRAISAKKPRVVGIPSDLPPQSGPKWAVRQEAANQNLSEAEMDSPP